MSKIDEQLPIFNLDNNNVDNYFTTHNRIGRGAFGNVYYATSTDLATSELSLESRKGFALKLIEAKSSDTQAFENVKNEFVLSNTVSSHPCFVKMYCMIQLNNNSFVLVMEYYPHEELIDALMKYRFEPNDKYVIIYQLIKSIEFMASLNIIHRDLKMENILIDINSLQLKIIDFGFSTTNDRTPKEACGSIQYVCPLVLSTTHYNKRVDVWSLGILIYIILTKMMFWNSIFKFENERNIITAMKRTTLTNEINTSIEKMTIDESLKNMLKCMLNPTNRTSYNNSTMTIESICNPENQWIQLLEGNIIDGFRRGKKMGYINVLEDESLSITETPAVDPQELEPEPVPLVADESPSTQFNMNN